MNTENCGNPKKKRKTKIKLEKYDTKRRLLMRQKVCV